MTVSMRCMSTHGQFFTATPNFAALATHGVFPAPDPADTEFRVPQRLNLQEIQQSFLRVQDLIRKTELSRVRYVNEVLDVLFEEK